MRQYLIKRMQLREKNLKYDFLPSMQEIIEKPGNPLVYVILAVVICLIISTIIWSSIYKLDIVVSGVGSVMPEDGIVVVSAPYSGLVDAVYVDEEDRVWAGDILWKMQDNEIATDLDAYYEMQKKLQVEYEVYSLIYDHLSGTEYYQKLEIDTSTYGDNQITADAIVLEYRVYEKDVETYKTQLLANVIQNIEQISDDIKSVEREIEALEEKLSMKNIKSEVSGVVFQMADIKKGDYISAGDALIGIVPFDKKLIINSFIQDKDIANVYVDMPVYIRLSAYDDTDYECISGRISKVGNVATTIEGYGKVFEVEITLETSPESLKMGMEGRVDIVLGQRTVMDYFLEPFTKAARDSLKE